jgi:uridine phosphorylase
VEHIEEGGGRHFHIPLSEHDDAPQAFIEPSEHIARGDVPEACVITFFGDVVDRLVERRGARVLVENRWEDGPHPLLEVDTTVKGWRFSGQGSAHPWLGRSSKK